MLATKKQEITAAPKKSPERYHLLDRNRTSDGGRCEPVEEEWADGITSRMMNGGVGLSESKITMKLILHQELETKRSETPSASSSRDLGVVCACMRACVRACLRVCVRTCVLTCVRACICDSDSILDPHPVLNFDLDAAPHSDFGHALDSNFGRTFDFDLELIFDLDPGFDFQCYFSSSAQFRFCYCIADSIKIKFGLYDSWIV
ncbi:hypothetical protein EVAR_54134_1 [Eumeta japonica]|uniref:Uncharacterized protein n=1 Tax=Eumeta variegata TaxID=151549 RepID=A0A4C1Z0B7_EUMVA|nr:hypothetical protein EVAR_54134_1 [Eumeta japonica]